MVELQQTCMDGELCWWWVAVLWGLSALAVGAAWLLGKGYNSLLYVPKLEPGQKPIPPGSLGYPVVGETLELFSDFNRGEPDGFWKKRVARYGKAGWYKTHLFGQPTILATVPEAVKLVLLSDSKFVSGWPDSTKRVVGRKSFLCISGEEHKRLRHLITPAVQGPSTLRRVVPRVEALALEALRSWAKQGKVDMVAELHKFTFNIIADMLMSMQPGPENDAFCHEFQSLALGLRTLHINLPGTPFNRALKARARILARMNKAIQARRDLMAAGTEKDMPRDVLQEMIENTDDQGRKLNNEEIMDVMIVFFLAGHETSATGALWIMLFLHQYPTVLAKLQEEQRKVCEEKGKAEVFSYADYKGMMYMQSVIDEMLRLVNLSPFTFRKAKEDVEVSVGTSGFTIPKGWSVQAWLRATHMDPETYPDPYRFNPDRWDKGEKPKAGAFTPFGAGGRSCVGMDLAKLELSIIVHHLVLGYSWEPVNPISKIKYLPHPEPGDGYLVNFYQQ